VGCIRQRKLGVCSDEAVLRDSKNRIAGRQIIHTAADRDAVGQIGARCDRQSQGKPAASLAHQRIPGSYPRSADLYENFSPARRWHRYRRQVQLFDTSKRADLDGPHYPRQGGRWHLIARHDLLFLFSEG
jgi:hypothetical protein